MTHIRYAILLLILLAVASAGCRGLQRAASTSDSELQGTRWQLVAFEGEAGSVIEGHEPTADFFQADARTRVGGSTGCNHYSATYELREGTIDVSQAVSTKMACGEAIMDQERRFLTLLEASGAWDRDGDMLHFADAGGRLLLSFVEMKDVEDEASTEPHFDSGYFVFTCTGEDEFAFTIRTDAGQMEVWLPARFGNRKLTLDQVRSASGARFEADDVLVWNKGNEARLEVGDETFIGCVTEGRLGVWSEARDRGIDFRAVGQEPGWFLEVQRGEELRFVYDYGESEVTTPSPEPVVEADGRTIYRADVDGDDLFVSINEQRCADTMSGELFDYAVSIEFRGMKLTGCGRDL